MCKRDMFQSTALRQSRCGCWRDYCAQIPVWVIVRWRARCVRFFILFIFFLFFPGHSHTLRAALVVFFLLSVRRWRRCVLRLVHVGVFAETDGAVFGDSADVPDRRLDFASIFSMSDSSRTARHTAAQAEANRRAGTAATAPAAAAAEVPGAAPEGSEAAGGARLPPAKRLQVDVGVDGKSVFCFLFFFFFFHRFMFSVAHFVVCIPVVSFFFLV